MIKKIFFLMIISFSILIPSNFVFSDTDCKYDSSAKNSWDTATNLMDCLENNESKLVVPSTDALVESWFKDKINSWVLSIAWFLGLVSVFALVYAGFVMATSIWDEEKIKKAKDLVKWVLLWFLAVVTSGTIITITINFMYSLWG